MSSEEEIAQVGSFQQFDRKRNMSSRASALASPWSRNWPVDAAPRCIHRKSQLSQGNHRAGRFPSRGSRDLIADLPTSPTIDWNSCAARDAETRPFNREAIESLQSSRIDPKFLYVTPRQAELWRQVFLRHSPIHGNPEFARIYRDAFAKILDRFPAGKVSLVGLGCGTGTKELELYSSLKTRGQCGAVFRH